MGLPSRSKEGSTAVAFPPEDFEAFIAERQRTIQDAIENLLIKERLDLSPKLRELGAANESAELRLRNCINDTLSGDVSGVPPHVIEKVDDRIARAMKKNAALDEDYYLALASKLEFFDLRKLQEAITSKFAWPKFEARFLNKEALNTKLDQLAELRNGIRHSRAVSEIVRKEGEAAIIWFDKVLVA